MDHHSKEFLPSHEKLSDSEIRHNHDDGKSSFTSFIRSEYDLECRSDTIRSDSLDGRVKLTKDTQFPQVPVEIHWSPGLGRYLVASREIPVGEVIFHESPLILAPKPGSEPVCLSCLKFWQKADAICENCGGPLCSSSCKGIGHNAIECNLIRCLGFKETRDITKKFREMSVVLAPLKMYLQMQESQFSKDVINALQSHMEIRKELPIGRIIEEKVVTAFQVNMGLLVDSEVVHQLCGALDTNSFEVSLDDKSRVRALFTLSSMMNHSCLPNTQRWFANNKLIIRAATHIAKGTPITTTYTQTLWGTRPRAAHLSTCKLFTCVCERCSDPTELASHMSSVLCKYCSSPESLLLPPSNMKQSWKCCSCGADVSSECIQAMIRAASGVFSRVNINDPKEILVALNHLCKLLGSQHYITMELKYALVQAIMKQPIKGLLLFYRSRAHLELLERQSGIDSSSSVKQVKVCNSSETPSKDLFSECSRKDLLSQLTECEFILMFDAKLRDVNDAINVLRRSLHNPK
ncbi:hypothetical protein SK128_022502 [Halocaridina rubra]|uniref:SET domain-containing protein n=1 Tax=Halocaridina rubra TaxID=373956 RepID=A0AAN8XND5_HALRR